MNVLRIFGLMHTRVSLFFSSDLFCEPHARNSMRTGGRHAANGPHISSPAWDHENGPRTILSSCESRGKQARALEFYIRRSLELRLSLGDGFPWEIVQNRVWLQVFGSYSGIIVFLARQGAGLGGGCKTSGLCTRLYPKTMRCNCLRAFPSSCRWQSPSASGLRWGQSGWLW